MPGTEGAVRACWEVVLALDMRELRGQLPEQLLLRLLLAHHGRHLLAQVPHDQAVDLGCSHPLHKLIHLRQHHTKSLPAVLLHLAAVVNFASHACLVLIPAHKRC